MIRILIFLHLSQMLVPFQSSCSFMDIKIGIQTKKRTCTSWRMTRARTISLLHRMGDILITADIEWNERLEEYFASTGEKAHCLSWLHKKSESMFSHRTILLDLPTIIIGAINGFLSVGSQQIFPGDSFASVYIGVVALFVSLLNTISSYFSWGRRAEGHRISSLQYAKLFHFLNIEMSLPQKERLAPSELLKYTKEAYDRLREISPLIPEPIIVEFRSEFQHENTISKPEEANGLEHIEIYKEKPTHLDPRVLGEVVKEYSPPDTPILQTRNLVVEIQSLEKE